MRQGRFKMIDLDLMLKSLRLAWLQRILNANQGLGSVFECQSRPWKCYLSRILTKFGGPFLFNCNYDCMDRPFFTTSAVVVLVS